MGPLEPIFCQVLLDKLWEAGGEGCAREAQSALGVTVLQTSVTAHNPYSPTLCQAWHGTLTAGGEVGDIVSILQMGRLRLREVQSLSRSHN